MSTPCSPSRPVHLWLPLSNTNMSQAEIQAAIPHRPPFLWLDEIVSHDANKIVCRKQFTGDEWFFAGHYPDDPIVPGVILCESAMQAGAALLALQGKSNESSAPPS